jgi:hypothetical protein
VSYVAAANTLEDSLISHWSLEEETGTRIDEVSGYDLTDGNSTGSTTGKVGDAAAFIRADSQYLSVPDNADLSTGGGKSFSVGAWVKLTSKSATQVFVGKYQNTATGEYALYYEPSNDRFTFSTYGNGDTYAVVADSLGSPALDTWYYVVGIHDGTDGSVNNRIVVNATYVNTAYAFEHADSNADLIVGAFTSGSFFTDGAIDEVSFWNRRLTMSDVASLYNNGTGMSYPFSEATSLAGGSGTAEDPYQITTCEGLQDMREHPHAHYKLMSDIGCNASHSWNPNQDEWVEGIIEDTLIPDSYPDVTHTDIVVNNNGYSGFSPIGTDVTPFDGELDGDGHSITNLWIFRKSTNFVGIFGYTVNAHIHDVTLSNSDIVGANYTGGIVGFADASIFSNITLDNNMVRVYLSSYGGGLAGYVNGDSTVSHITNNGGNVHGSGIIVGGLVGEVNGGEFTDLDSSADVDGGYEIGGLFGVILGSSINDAHATGDVTADYSEYVAMKTGYYAGGFAGYISDSAEISNASASSTVTSQTRYSGGFAGYVSNNVYIANASSTGSVTSYEQTVNETLMDVFSVGGFIGASFGSHFSNAQANVLIDSDGDAVGGFVGTSACESTYTQTSATGNVTGYDRVGGFAGEDGCEGPGSTFTESFSTGNVEGNDYVGGFIGNASVSALLNIYSLGTVYGNNNVGGLFGASNSGTVSKSYVAGEVTGVGENNIGGFIGSNGDTNIEYSFWDLVAVDQSESCGNGECAGVSGTSTLAMKSQVTFRDVSWDFVDIWGMNTEDNNGYPFFLYQNFTPDEYAPDPETTPRKHKRSSSVRSQVKHLEDNGNNTGAADLKAQFPQVFATTLGGGQTKTTFTKSLQLGMTDTEVTTLQHFLIEYKAGPAAAALAAHGVTGYFGPLTRAALIEFQKAKGITPAIGFFGPITRGVANSI